MQFARQKSGKSVLSSQCIVFRLGLLFHIDEDHGKLTDARSGPTGFLVYIDARPPFRMLTPSQSLFSLTELLTC